jgi:hypothetical protein
LYLALIFGKISKKQRLTTPPKEEVEVCPTQADKTDSKGNTPKTKKPSPIYPIPKT